MRPTRLHLLFASVVAIVTVAVVARTRVRRQSYVAWAEVVGQAGLMADALYTGQLSLVDAKERALHAAAKRLTRAKWIVPLRSRELRSALAELSDSARSTHAAADDGNVQRANVEFDATKRALVRLKEILPQDFLPLPPIRERLPFVCPMHPEIQSREPGSCSACGMPLEPRVKSAQKRYVTATIEPNGKLRVGERARLTLQLTSPDGNITLEDLLEVHTRKIHLLIVDRSLTDYHHEHPVPNGAPGRYAFEFTPSKPGPYKVWADVLPAATRLQEFPATEIPGAGDAEPFSDHTARWADTVNGIRYELIPAGTLRQDVTTKMELRITRDGSAFDRLEPIMGTYAHLVAFSQDLEAVSHIHPLGAPPSDNAQLGHGPFEVLFVPRSAGPMAMFAQVQMGGTSQFARFVLNVEPPEGFRAGAP